ncbi:thioredoxin-like protein [Ceratobasidium sp. AG-Ba]|nr:thioredoxin-like protein [Ceratobasidium sp. AG-Ba]
MPLIHSPTPGLIASLGGNAPPTRPFLVFYSDIVDGQMWCPDCRNVEQVVKRAFDNEDGPTGIIRWVGNRADWKSPSNVYRRDYGVSSVPTIIRLKDGKEDARLVDREILDSAKLKEFLEG